MRLVYDPKVYLIAKPMLLQENVLQYLVTECEVNTEFGEKFVNSQNDIEKLVEIAGKVCYVSYKNTKSSTSEFISQLLKMGHGSVLEHANFTFVVTRCSRGFTHQMVRHRAGFAYSQESTHFRNYNKKNFSFKLESSMKQSNKRLIKKFEKTALQCIVTYERIKKELVKQNMAKKTACSIARQILPIGVESRLVFTGNLRALRHFIELRATRANCSEITEIAIQVYDILKREVPSCMIGLEKHTKRIGTKDISYIKVIDGFTRKV